MARGTDDHEGLMTAAGNDYALDDINEENEDENEEDFDRKIDH